MLAVMRPARAVIRAARMSSAATLTGASSARAIGFLRS